MDDRKCCFTSINVKFCSYKGFSGLTSQNLVTMIIGWWIICGNQRVGVQLGPYGRFTSITQNANHMLQCWEFVKILLPSGNELFGFLCPTGSLVHSGKRMSFVNWVDRGTIEERPAQ